MGLNAVFSALSHTARRRILRLLREGPMSAGEIAGHFTLSKPTLSVHLAALHEAELVTRTRKGTRLIYHINLSILEDALAGVLAFKEKDP